MGTARIVFTRFPSPRHPRLAVWSGHLNRVAGVDETLRAGADSAVVWQLVSGNFRPLGRRTAVFASVDEARDDALRMVEEENRMLPQARSEQRYGGFGWYLTLDGLPVLACARWYFNDRDRAHAIELARDALAHAVLKDAVNDIRPTFAAE